MQKKGRGKEANGPRAEGQLAEAAKAEPLATRNANARQSWTANGGGPMPSREAAEKANDLKHQAKAKRPSIATGTSRANPKQTPGTKPTSYTRTLHQGATPGRTPGTRPTSDTRANQSRASAWNRNALRQAGKRTGAKRKAATRTARKSKAET